MTLPEYPRWDAVPDHLKTKTQLSKLGIKPAKNQRPTAVKTHWKYNVPDYALYDIADAVPKRRCTPAQLAALEKARRAARTCPVCQQEFAYRGWRVAKWTGFNGGFGCWVREEQRVVIDWAREVEPMTVPLSLGIAARRALACLWGLRGL